MATLPSFFRRAIGAPIQAQAAVRADYDPYRLRALPHEDVFFFSKKIDNTRVVREADPEAGRVCRSALGAACAVLALLGLVLTPAVANRMASSRLEELRAEQQHLLEQRRGLELREAELLSPLRLDQLAKDRGLVVPGAGQVFHLEPKDEGAVAMVRR
jgi:hypothetical protein